MSDKFKIIMVRDFNLPKGFGYVSYKFSWKCYSTTLNPSSPATAKTLAYIV